MENPSKPLFFCGTALPQNATFDAWADQPLLISAELGGIDWPSSCRNGTCRTCLGTLTKGEVAYQIEWPGLSREEMASGCVLPCVAYPQSDVTILRESF
jgi:ferredoxin